MRFLFRLDLSLHAGAEFFFWNFEFRNQTRPEWEHADIPVDRPVGPTGLERACSAAVIS